MGLRRLLPVIILATALGIAAHPVAAQRSCPLLGEAAYRLVDQHDGAAITQALCRFLSPHSSDDDIRRIVAVAIEQPMTTAFTDPVFFFGRFRSPLPWPLSLVYWLRVKIVRAPDGSGRIVNVHATYSPF